MIPCMALSRIDIARGGLATEFSHALQVLCIKPKGLIRLAFSDADF
jgi:hypothetical protein